MEIPARQIGQAESGTWLGWTLNYRDFDRFMKPDPSSRLTFEAAVNGREENELLDGRLACQLHPAENEGASGWTRHVSCFSSGGFPMKQLAILALVFCVSACLASVSWAQHYHGGGSRHGGYYSGYRGSGTTIVVGVNNGFGYNRWGYGHQPYYRPSRAAYYGGFGYGVPVRHGYYRPVYPAPGCGYGRGFSGGGIYFGW